jgi:hypothetical protein
VKLPGESAAVPALLMLVVPLIVALVFCIGRSVGYNSGVNTGVEAQRAEVKKRDAQLQADLAAPIDGVCPMYRQMRDCHICQDCIQWCWPMIDGGTSR